jgi:hypothetical protein
MEIKEKREMKIRKSICEGDAVSVSALYQWATIFFISTGYAQRRGRCIPYADSPRMITAKIACRILKGRSNPNAIESLYSILSTQGFFFSSSSTSIS